MVARTVRFVVASSTALGLWAWLLNRTVIQWVDGPWKSLAAAALAVGLGALALLSVAQASRRAWIWAWCAILVLFGLGEARRAWLRSSYRAEDGAGAPSLFDPVTTTALEVRRFTLAMPGLPAPRLRVAHLTDLHVTEAVPAAYTKRVQRELEGLAPDLIVMTGDYLSKIERLHLLRSWLRGMPDVRYGAFAVLGNHDYWTERPDQIQNELERAGIRLVSGRCAILDVAPGGALGVCGTEQPWGAPLADLPEATPSIVLSHTPDNIYELAELGASAVFAGHTHGGQIRLAGLGALIVPSNFGRRFDRGHFVVDGTHLFVSAGVGADAPALRLWCPPEIVVVDLVRPEP